jgi:hypothetical protein
MPNAATCVKQVFDQIIHRGNKMKIEGGCYCGEVRYESNGEPASFARPDLDNPVSRMFCKTCGTALGTESPAMPAAIIIKVGTMDDPSFYSPRRRRCGLVRYCARIEKYSLVQDAWYFTLMQKID